MSSKETLKDKFFSRTWRISKFAMCLAGYLTIVFTIALFIRNIDISWYVPCLGFCSGVFGLFTGMEKLIDKERIKNGNKTDIGE